MNIYMCWEARCQVYNEVESKTLHFGHCHLLHFSTTHASLLWNLRNLQAHTTSSFSSQFPFKQSSRTSGGKLAKYQQNSWLGNEQQRKRSRNVAGTDNRAEIFSERCARDDCATEELPVCTPVRKLGGKTKRLAVDGKTFLENRFRGLPRKHAWNTWNTSKRDSG